jgi:hypothetical protein
MRRRQSGDHLQQHVELQPLICSIHGGSVTHLFEGAGFDLARVIDTSTSMHIVEARPT